MLYQEFNPSPALKPYIDCFWTNTGSLPDPSQPFRCIPNGRLDIVISTSAAPTWVQRSENWEQMPNAFITGIWTEPAVMKWDYLSWFGIRLKPEMFVHLFQQPMREMENVTLDIRVVLGAEVDKLASQMAEASDHQQRISMAEAFITRELTKRQLPQSTYLSEAMRLIRKHSGQVSTGELSRQVFVGERQLQRAFREYFGASPKTYGRIARFNYANQLVMTHPNSSWVEVSYTCGYADQAHFIRDCKAFAGEVPTTLFAGIKLKTNHEYAM